MKVRRGKAKGRAHLLVVDAQAALATPPGIPSKATAQSQLNALTVKTEGSMTGSPVRKAHAWALGLWHAGASIDLTITRTSAGEKGNSSEEHMDRWTLAQVDQWLDWVHWHHNEFDYRYIYFAYLAGTLR